MAPEICPQCGAVVPPNAAACPECGADEHTGWSERAQAQRLGIPDDEFDYDEYVREEFGEEKSSRVRPKGIAWHWWLVAIVLILLFLKSFWR